MSPLRATKVIPSGWSRHHAPAASGAMNARCRIYDPSLDTTGWDEQTQSATRTAGAPLYDGHCRIQAVQAGHASVQADEQIEHRDYLIQLPFDAPSVGEGFRVEPYAVLNDAAGLHGARLVVRDPQEGSERFTRDLICQHVQH